VKGSHCSEEQPFIEPPSVRDITLYLSWLVRSSCGQIDEKITDVTVGNQLSSLKRAIKIHTNYQYNRAQNDALVSVSASIHRDALLLI
jgi:hypothetical protein